MGGKRQPVLGTPSNAVGAYGMQPQGQFAQPPQQGQFAVPQAQSMPAGSSGPTSGGAV
jgi:hypothetical protein